MKTTMTPEIYESKRNDLISMLDSILTTATGLSAPARKELEETAAKLKRNSFEIVLVGEFQGGKSTTFDTICDGREISPRGIGIKTSACKISAQSVPADQPERADLTWKSDVELMQTMIGIVRDNLVNDKDAYALFTKKDKNGIDVLPSLSDPHIHQLAKKAIHAEWERYNANMANYDPDQRGLLDLLKISTLILDFCNSPELAKLKAKTTVTIDELKPLVVFPQEWEERWLNGENAQWTFSEIPFVFLGSVFCHIHCANLERLGCVITDCPGLFAGPWDTAVAQKAMMQADAILYLIGGQKAVTEADLRALTEIRKTQQGHKVFFAINARLSKANIAGPIRQADFSMIRQRGYEIDNAETIDVFNSLLAFGAKAEKPTDEKAEKIRKREINHAIETYFSLDLTDEDDLLRAKKLRENRPELYKASDFPSILAKIETDVVTKKFKSILVNGGTSKASAALDALNGDLIVKEKAAQDSVDKAEGEVENARTRLAEFQDFATNEVDCVLGDSNKTDLLAQDFFQTVYLENDNAISDAICRKLRARFSKSKDLLSIVWDLMCAKVKSFFGGTESDEERAREKAGQVLNRPVQEAVEEIALPAAEGWVSNIREGGNQLFDTTFGAALTTASKKVKEKWDSMFGEKETLLRGLSLDIDISLAPINSPIGNQEATGITVQKEALGILLRKIGATIGAAVVGLISAILIAFIMVSLGLGGLPALIPIVAGGFLGVKFAQWVNDKILNGLETRLRPEITSKLRTLLSEQKEVIKQAAKDDIISLIVDELKIKFRRSLSGQKERFEARVNETLKLKQIDQKEKDRIAAEAKKVREEQIEPARKQIAEFHKGLEPFFEADSKQEA